MLTLSRLLGSADALGKQALMLSSGMAKEILRELSEHTDQILQIPRRLVLRTCPSALLRPIKLGD
jgi:hypothetical protein